MNTVNNLLTLSERYSVVRDVTEQTVSGLIYKNSRVFRRIRNGGDISVRNYDKGIQWFRDNWPDGVKWPLREVKQ